MHLDDVALRVMEEDLMPAVHRPGAVVRVGDALLVEPLLEGGDIVGAERNVSALQRVDRVFGAEADAEVLLRQVKLGGAIMQKRDVAAVTLGGDADLVERRLRLEVEDRAVE